MANQKKCRHVERFVSQMDLEVAGNETLRIRPDLAFGVGNNTRQRLYFLKADRGSERPANVAAKLAAYETYLVATDPKEPSRRLWQRHGSFGDFRVLVVKTTKRRVRSLAEPMRDQPGWDSPT